MPADSKFARKGEVVDSSAAAVATHDPKSVNGLFQIHLAKESKGAGCVLMAAALAVVGIFLVVADGVSSLWWLFLVAAALALLVRPLFVVKQPRIWGRGLAFSTDSIEELHYSDGSLRSSGFEDVEQGKGALHDLTEWKQATSVPFEGRTLALTLQPDCSQSFKIGRATLISGTGVDLDLCDTYISGDPAIVITHESSFGVIRSGQILWTRAGDTYGEHLLKQLDALAEICPPKLRIALTFNPRGESPIMYGLLATLVGAHRDSKLTGQLEKRTLVNENFCNRLFSLVERNRWAITNLSEPQQDPNFRW